MIINLHPARFPVFRLCVVFGWYSDLMCEVCSRITLPIVLPDTLPGMRIGSHAPKLARVVCEGCRLTMRRAPDRLIEDIPIRTAFRHEGPAASLVHQLKYRGHTGLVNVFAPAMLEALPSDAAVLVPIPRVWARRVRYGIDPAVELTMAMSRTVGLPVVRALVAPPLGAARAGRRKQHRDVVRFRVRSSVRGAVVVDDVVTTGATMRSAIATLGRQSVIAGLAATAAV